MHLNKTEFYLNVGSEKEKWKHLSPWVILLAESPVITNDENLIIVLSVQRYH